MDPFRQHRGLVLPLWRSDIDTDQIVPKQFLTAVTRSGFDRALFHSWRTKPDGTLDDRFPLNQPRYAGASVLAAGANFGCGSSREHAAWALVDAGFRAVIAPSFADIFLGNAVNNGLLAIALPAGTVETIAARAAASAYEIVIDLEALRVADDSGLDLRFTIDPAARERLLEGLDPTAIVLRHREAIEAFERRYEAPQA